MSLLFVRPDAPETSKENTRLTYLYRDASNYKERQQVIVKGRLHWADVRGCLSEACFFIPGQVDLPELQQRLTGFPSDEDHVWHELGEENLEPTNLEPDRPELTAATLLRRFQQAQQDGWDVRAAMKRLGLKE